MRKNAVLFAMAIAISPTAARADDKDISPLTQALFSNMALSYMCRIEIGAAHYGAARTLATDLLTQYIGRKNAVLAVDTMDQKFKADPRAKEPKANAAKCFELKSDAMHRIEVERAKLTD